MTSFSCRCTSNHPMPLRSRLGLPGAGSGRMEKGKTRVQAGDAAVQGGSRPSSPPCPGWTVRVETLGKELTSLWSDRLIN